MKLLHERIHRIFEEFQGHVTPHAHHQANVLRRNSITKFVKKFKLENDLIPESRTRDKTMIIKSSLTIEQETEQ